MRLPLVISLGSAGLLALASQLAPAQDTASAVQGIPPIAPTGVITLEKGDLPAGHRLLSEELFLPFIAFARYDKLDQALAQGNAVRYGLTAGIYTTQQEELDTFLERAEAGVLYANRAHGATTGAWPGFQTFPAWKGSGVSGKGGFGQFDIPQFMREQSHTLMEI